MSNTLSLRPADDVEGGLFDDFDGTVKSARYTMYDYPNKAGKPSTEDGQPVLTVKLTLINPDAEKPIEQYYSVGAKGFKPNPADGGKTAVADGDARGIGKMSNFAVFRNEVINVGFPEERITDDLSCFDGLVAHWNQKAQPKRSNAKPDEKEKKLLVPTKILSLPGEKAAVIGGGKKATGGSTSANKPTAASSGGSSDVLDAAVKAVVTVLAKRGTLTTDELKMEVFRDRMKDKKRNEIVELATSEAFQAQGAMDGHWDVNEDGALVQKAA